MNREQRASRGGHVTRRIRRPLSPEGTGIKGRHPYMLNQLLILRRLDTEALILLKFSIPLLMSWNTLGIADVLDRFY